MVIRGVERVGVDLFAKSVRWSLNLNTAKMHDVSVD
jgi:hypothetical protein